MEGEHSVGRRELLEGLERRCGAARRELARAGGDASSRSRQQIEARLEALATLSRLAERYTVAEVVDEALRRYRGLPSVSDRLAPRFARFVGQEQALEEFFDLVGLDPRRPGGMKAHRPRIVEESLGAR